MAKFAKIIELDNARQVLLTKVTDDGDPGLKITVRNKGVTSEITIGWDSEEPRDDLFENFDKEMAEAHYKDYAYNA